MKTALVSMFAAGLLASAAIGSAQAQTATVVGTITACYFAQNCGFVPVIDGPSFQFTNTGKTAITAAKFTVMANASDSVVKDSYFIGRIAPGASVVVTAGASNDKRTHPGGGMFTYIGGALDTSDSGPDADNMKFVFSGMAGTQKVTSGTILVSKSAGPSNDGTVAHLNFLGGPANADGPCNDCFGPKQIALITLVPLPAAALTEGLQ